MKKLLFLLCALFMVGVSQAQTPQTQPQSKTWKVGDIYTVNGQKGVVFAVSPDGQHARIVSLEHIECNWDNAKIWCTNLGDGWRLPTRAELQRLYREKVAVNEVLFWAEKGQIEYSYWTKEEFDLAYAWYVRMSDGLTGYKYKCNHNSVRAVSAF